jgi:hypothetical protein
MRQQVTLRSGRQRRSAGAGYFVAKAVVLGGLAFALASCSSGSSGHPSATGDKSHGASHVTSTTGSTTSAPTTVAASAPKVAMNLPVTAAIRTDLIAVAAASSNIPVSQVVMEPNLTYYAYDPTSATYWAGAKFETTPSSPNETAFEDANSYFIFSMTNGGSWMSRGAGLEGTSCPPIPAAIVALWNWTAGTCDPPPSATAPAVPAGFTAAKTQWIDGSSEDAAAMGNFWIQAVSDLQSALTAEDAGTAGYPAAIQELQQLTSLPDTDDTPVQTTEINDDITALNQFFSTPGLYS